MFYPAQIRTTELARLCRRLSTALDAGIETRRVWERESNARQSTVVQERLKIISSAVAEGEEIQSALKRTGTFFPPLFHQLVTVGEETGQLPEVLRHLAEYYDEQLKLRTEFLRSIAGPALQFGAAVVIIGFLIWVLGLIADIMGTNALDITGVGLIGTRGLVVYLTFWILLLTGIWIGYIFVRRGAISTAWFDRNAMKLPVVGPALRTLALSRLAWAMKLTLDTGMSLKKAIPLVFRSTDNAVYIALAPQVVQGVMAGDSLTEVLGKTNAFPTDFLDTLEVGEQTGRIPESMAHLSAQYQERARQAFSILAKVAAFLIWGLVSIFLAAMVIRIFYVAYLGPLYEAMKG